MNELNISPELKHKIIATITERSDFFTTYKSRKERLIHLPLKTFWYYALSVLAHRKPFKIKYKALWEDSLSFYLPEGGAIYYYGFFEAGLTNLFLRLIKEGDVFVDVGAHVGYYSNLCSHLVGSTGQVHSFEPTPRTFESLRENTKKFAHARINNAGVLDKETTIHFVDYGPKYSAFNSFESRSNKELAFLDKEKRDISVPTVVLDDYFAKQNVTPTFIKIDAEGADHLVLKGMKNTLQHIRPVVSVEVAGGAEWNENHNSCLSVLRENKYVGFQMATDGTLIKQEEYKDSEYDNLLFLPEEKAEGILASLMK